MLGEMFRLAQISASWRFRASMAAMQACWKMTEETQKELVALQRKMLSTVKDYVKPGGTLVYSTCTIHEEENMGNVHWFLEQNKEFELVPIAQLLCEELKNDVVEQGCIQLLPGIHDSDGFFIAKFRKVKCE